jgi:hypothetical protein
MFKATVITLFFKKHFFPLSNVRHSFSKLKKVLRLTIIKAKALEIGQFHLKSQ